jgi:hypothetical protein
LVFSYVLQRLGVLLNFSFFTAGDLCKIIFLLTFPLFAFVPLLLLLTFFEALMKALLYFKLTLLNVLKHFNGDMPNDEE